VGDVWGWRDGVEVWWLSWRRLPFNWEVGLINELLNVLQGFRGVEADDVWWWNAEEGGIFSLRSSYKLFWIGCFWGRRRVCWRREFLNIYGKVSGLQKLLLSLGPSYWTIYPYACQRHDP
jgi:hypothetical protein